MPITATACRSGSLRLGVRMFGPMDAARSAAHLTARARMRTLMVARLGFLAALLVAVLLLHVSGTELVVIRIARFAIIALVLVVLGRGRARRGGPPREPPA